MKVVISAVAQAELGEIWRWNAVERGPRPANDYLAFLKKAIGKLSTSYSKGRPIGSNPSFRYILMQRRPGGHGHVAVYEVIDNSVVVLHVYHTSQDWQAKL